ncbi:unnamed protein product [Brachionus calyciflorus]|uniref:SWIM-type domain-containing protein n=1 Tax=Brachionus calyciflorus TaxID=104777 RepID=A0A814RZ64_9BILA|nr:unnamed protein product [Brachionus calyciflorus]
MARYIGDFSNKSCTVLYYKVDLGQKNYSDKFIKYVFGLPDIDCPVVVQYLGEPEVYKPSSRGNSKNKNSVFQATKPSDQETQSIASLKFEFSEQNTNENNIDSNGSSNSTNSNSLESDNEQSNIIMSKKIRAKWLVENGMVILSKLGCFNVKDDNDEIYLVNLFPKPKCTCVIKEYCCHIMAVHMNIGYNVESKKKKPLTLTKLRAKAKNNKESGRKYRENYEIDVELSNKDIEENQVIDSMAQKVKNITVKTFDQNQIGNN